jgi:lauroyl/myristoyl acyltransferase
MVINEGVLKDIGRVFVWFLLRYLVFIFPSPSELGIHRLLGKLYYYLDRKKGQLIRENMFHAVGSMGSSEQAVRLHFENHFIDQYFIFSFPKLGATNIGRYLFFEGLDYLDDALEKGKGVIIIHAHLGPRLLSLFALGLKGYKVNQIEGPIIEELSAFGGYCVRQKVALEKSIPATLINGRQFLRPAFDVLRNNEMVMMAGDGMGGGKFLGRQLAINFLGHKLKFPAGPVVLASKTGASLIPLFTIKGKGDPPYRAIIHAPLAVRHGRLKEREVANCVGEFVRLLEGYVIKEPYLWHFWDEFWERTGDAL